MTALGMSFNSVVAQPITVYVRAKSAVGCAFASEARRLRLFDRFLVTRHISTLDAITNEVIEAFLASRSLRAAKSYNGQREEPRRRPFLFSVPQMRQLLEMARRLPDRNRGPRRGPTYYAVFAVLYGLGLRVGEISRLTLGDLDLDRQLLWIRNSKFGKSRLVPFGPRLAGVLRDYVEHSPHAKHQQPNAPLFTFNGRRAVSPNSIRNAFRDQLMPRLAFVVPPGTRTPRVHDLRHSFAVAALLRWYRAGVDRHDSTATPLDISGARQSVGDGRLSHHHR